MSPERKVDKWTWWCGDVLACRQGRRLAQKKWDKRQETGVQEDALQLKGRQRP